MNPQQRPLAFVIHDLNSWGGHDRSTLEIARRISHRFPVDIYSFTLNDPKGLQAWGNNGRNVRFHKIRPNFDHPVFAKLALFHAATLAPLRVGPRLRKRASDAIAGFLPR